MLAFDAPFIADPGYVNFLRNNAPRFSSLHFSLQSGGIPDARHDIGQASLEQLQPLLAATGITKKYGLLNSRVHEPDTYRESESLRHITDCLERLFTARVLDGVIYSDHYLLAAIARSRPDLAGQLEAVPSVNHGLDTVAKVEAVLDYIHGTGFRPPGKIVLDRTLNRDLDTLESVASAIKKHRPELRLALLANEGCLANCPFRPAHESHLAMNRLGLSEPAPNRTLGCSRLFFQEPFRLFASPFIRPEDTVHYQGLVHDLKICGRTRSPETMREIVSSYLRGEYRGNLLLLCDSMEPLAERIEIDNAQLPRDFLQRVSRCSGVCASCKTCRNLADTHVRLLTPGLKPFKA